MYLCKCNHNTSALYKNLGLLYNSYDLKTAIESKHECPNIICIEKTIRVTSGKLGPDVHVKYFVIILRISAP